MWRSKKIIIAAVVLAALVLVGGIGGVALAQTTKGENSQSKALLASDNTSQSETLMARIAEILGIDQQKVEDAFTQARSDMRNEALDNYLNKLVGEGTITQEQADQYKAWVQAKPDLAPYQQQLKDWAQTRPNVPPELKQWQDSRPDMPLPGGSFGGMGGRAFRGGMRGGGGGCFWGR